MLLQRFVNYLLFFGNLPGIDNFGKGTSLGVGGSNFHKTSFLLQ